jgi:RNA polymerase sigma factor (sigma-70 family)
MRKATASPIVQFIRQVVEDQRVLELSDQQLLQRFRDQQDPAAFQALLRRHGPMVLEVCRGVLGNEADVEDAFQATFLILLRNAGSIRKREALASWLHGVAYRTALKARAQSAMRHKHEARMPERQASGADDLTWPEVRHVLHEELHGLPNRYRAPLVLCYLEGATQEAAAVQLGLAKSTLRERLERGRALLRARLLRRGLGPTALLVVSAWPAANAPASVPLALIQSTVKAATLLAAEQTATGVVSARVAAFTEGVRKIMLHGKGTRITLVLGLFVALAAGVGMTLQGVWAQNSGEKKQEAPRQSWKSAGVLQHNHAVLCLAFGPDQFLVAGDEGPPGTGDHVRVWDAATKKELRYNRGDDKEIPESLVITGITYAADNSWVSFRAKGSIHLAGGDYIRDGKVIGGGGGTSSNRPLAIASDGMTHALVGKDPNTVRMFKYEIDWDKNRAKFEDGATCKGHTDEPLCAAFSPDGALLVTGSADKTARIWDPTLGNEKHVLRGHTDSILVVAFSPDGKLVATGGKDGLVKFWNVETGKEQASLKGHTAVRCLAFSPDGKTLVSGGEDETVRIWDVAAGKEQVVLRDHKGTVLAVAFSRDGRLLASAGTDKTIRLWKKK